MKSFAHKLLACTFIFALATGCASSVTDAGMSSQPKAKAPSVQKPKPNNPGFDTDSDMVTILDKPKL